jgi:hypothetical protein
VDDRLLQRIARFVDGLQIAGLGRINEFSTDGTMADNSDSKVATQQATVEYVAAELSDLSLGKVLQVVQNTYSTDTTTTSTSFVATGLTCAITPSSATSKVLMFAWLNAQVYYSSQGQYFAFVRNTTSILGFGEMFNRTRTGTSGSVLYAYDSFDTISAMYLDSPSTTSSITYRVYHKAASGTSRVQVNSTPSVMILMEIAS